MHQLSSSPLSARDIVIRPKRSASSGDNSLLGRLIDLKAACGTNQNDRAIALITACLSEGVDTKKGIIELLQRVGLNGRHVAIMLDKGNGRTPEGSHWRRNEDESYSLHADA